MNMPFVSKTSACVKARDDAPAPLDLYEADECQMTVAVADGNGGLTRPWLTTVREAASGRVVAAQITPGPMDRRELAALARGFNAVFLERGSPGRWAIAVERRAEVGQ